MITFYLNGQPQMIEGTDPNLSILEWLRTKMRLTGTKEGCASGDCGACTVSIGTPTGHGEMRYDSVNSCIALVGSLHGKHLVTVDGLQGDASHPVQASMVRCHGSQCGFCTPGIVMSLFSLHTETNRALTPPSHGAIIEALSGNLCRCTGYRPIVEAAQEALVQTWDGGSAPAAGQCNSPTELHDSAMIAELSEAARDGVKLEATEDGRLDGPTSLAELKKLKSQFPKARLIAGGTDLALEITQRLATLPHLIATEWVPELQTLESTDGYLHIGAAVTYRQLMEPLSQRWPSFHAMLERLGSRQIRNRGTVGGNIGNASPIGDMPPALIALGADVQLDGPDGEHWLPLQDYFIDYKQTALKPAEFIRGVRIPEPTGANILCLHKVSKRLDDDISAVLGAFWFHIEDGVLVDCRLAYGGMAAIPKRATGAEQVLRGQALSEAAFASAMAALDRDFTPLSDVRASATYRQQVARNLLQRVYLELITRDDLQPTPLTVTDYA